MSNQQSGTHHQDDIEISGRRVLEGKLEGNAIVRSGAVFEVTGMVTGHVVVEEGGELILKGMICRDLTLTRGAHATIAGFVCGVLRNNGGRADVQGMVGEISGEGETRLSKDSRVVGRPR